MKDPVKFITKIIIFSIPFVLYGAHVIHELFYLPLDYYTFRGWEALIVREQNDILTGPFYPNTTLKTIESGDITKDEQFAINKDVEWHTDKYGYRKNELDRNKHEIVVIGDSFIAGTALTQSDILSEKLESKLNVSVYPYSPSNFTKFIDDERFIKHPPDIVIFQSTEKLVRNLPNVGVGGEEPKGNFSKYLRKMRFLPGLDRLVILNDRYLKQNSLNYAYARIYNFPKVLVNKLIANSNPTKAKTIDNSQNNLGLNVSKDGKMVFTVQSPDKYVEWKSHEFDIAVDRIESYKDYIEQRGIRFIFLPVPNKENIYYSICEGGVKMHSLENMIAELEKRGVDVIDTQNAYDKAYLEDPDKLIYYPDDTHWTPYGVEIVVDLLTSVID